MGEVESAVFNACVELLRHASERQLKIVYRFLLVLVAKVDGDEKKGD